MVTLLDDYHPFVVPNRERLRFAGHTGNIKCVDFLGDVGTYVLSGGSDNTLRVWETLSGASVSVSTPAPGEGALC